MTHTPTTIKDVLKHVLEQQAGEQAMLDKLFADRRELPYSDQCRFIDLQIEKAHGRIMALATVAGYLEARLSIDEIYASEVA